MDSTIIIYFTSPFFHIALNVSLANSGNSRPLPQPSKEFYNTKRGIFSATLPAFTAA